MGRCSAPCDGTISEDGYAEVVEQVRSALSTDVRPAVSGLQDRLSRLIDQQRFEEAAAVRQQLNADSYRATGSIECAAWRVVQRSSPPAGMARIGTST